MAKNSRRLIEQAFEKAREFGRSDWNRMTVAVLKNRLLDLTDRTFKESDYGSGTFWEFVKGNKDILILDETTTPPVAILKGVSPNDHASAQSRIRPDLWRAVLDFSSGDKYFWDPGEKKALIATSNTAPGPEIATIAVEVFNEWKRRFAKDLGDIETEDRLAEWVDNRRPATLLSPQLRHRWNGYLKKEVKDHLLSWFGQENLEPPANLLEVQEVGGSTVRSEDLRRRLIACLRSMTSEELERVQIPASVLLRLK